MTAFLGLGVMSCGDNSESTVEESNEAQPEVALVDNANIDKGEKGENSAPEKSDATDPEKDTEPVAEKILRRMLQRLYMNSSGQLVQMNLLIFYGVMT